jgi:hypothetical protein
MNTAAFLLNAGRPGLALQEVDRLREIETTSELVMLGAACAEEVGSLPDWVNDLHAAHLVDPHSERVRTWLSRACYSRAVRSIESGDLPFARSDARRVVELTPTEPGPFLLLAQIAAMEGDRASARRHLRRALELDNGHRLEEAVRGDPLLEPLLH